jgi:hypothetical protein
LRAAGARNESPDSLLVDPGHWPHLWVRAPRRIHRSVKMVPSRPRFAIGWPRTAHSATEMSEMPAPNTDADCQSRGSRREDVGWLSTSNLSGLRDSPGLNRRRCVLQLLQGLRSRHRQVRPARPGRFTYDGGTYAYDGAEPSLWVRKPESADQRRPNGRVLL